MGDDRVGGPSPSAVLRWLERAQTLGFLGPGAVPEQVRHADALTEFAGPPAGRVLDLGAGGGLPGLVLAQRWPDANVALLDATRRRCVFLREAVVGLGWALRVEVIEGRAEAEARDPRWRERFELVTARSFGPPPVTAECAVGFVQPGGRLVVSEPPDDAPERWPARGLEQLGLELVRVERVGPARFAELRRSGGLDDQWPRRVGVPAKRPLW